MNFLKSIWAFLRDLNIWQSQTPHQRRIEKMMLKAKQTVPDSPIVPSEYVRMLRARLVLEEALELIDALQVDTRLVLKAKGSLLDEDVTADGTPLNHCYGPMDVTKKFLVVFNRLELTLRPTWPELSEIVKEAADVSVVTIGTLSACGVKDKPVLKLVDENNLQKFGPGSYIDEHGKLIRPIGYKSPDIVNEIYNQGY